MYHMHNSKGGLAPPLETLIYNNIQSFLWKSEPNDPAPKPNPNWERLPNWESVIPDGE
jgi:hypothetical protein